LSKPVGPSRNFIRVVAFPGYGAAVLSQIAVDQNLIFPILSFVSLGAFTSPSTVQLFQSPLLGNGSGRASENEKNGKWASQWLWLKCAHRLRSAQPMHASSLFGAVLALLLSALACTPSYSNNPGPSPGVADPPSPAHFVVKMQLSSGDQPLFFNITRQWAPLGADRFYALVQDGHYNCAGFYRVIPGFIAQVYIFIDTLSFAMPSMMRRQSLLQYYLMNYSPVADIPIPVYVNLFLFVVSSAQLWPHTSHHIMFHIY
jgi:hypothetical protein